MDPTDVLFLQPWDGGSHRAFAEAWKKRSRHRIEVRALAPRHWRWRQAASAWELARAVAERPPSDVLVVTDYVDLPRLRGLLPPAWRAVPTLAYFHESQLTYPLGPDAGGTAGARDLSPAWSNVLTAACADALVFNSRFHRDDFGAAADAWLARLPRPNPREELCAALERASVVSPAPELAAVPLGGGAPAGAPLRIVFPHRFEHDKEPLAFLRAVVDARTDAAPIELVLLGERFEGAPDGVARELERLGAAVLHSGFVEDRAKYLHSLATCDVVASTATHEFFGVALLEGVAAGCRPLAPGRLAYADHFADSPEALFDDCEELVHRLRELAAEPDGLRRAASREAWRRTALTHDAAPAAEALDELVRELALRRGPR